MVSLLTVRTLFNGPIYKETDKIAVLAVKLICLRGKIIIMIIYIIELLWIGFHYPMQTEAKLYWCYDWLAILYGIILRIKHIVIYNEKKRKETKRNEQKRKETKRNERVFYRACLLQPCLCYPCR